MAATATKQFTRKCSTRDLFFEEPVEVKGLAESTNGHVALVVGEHNLKLNLPDWFANQYVAEGRVEVGDYISGGWADGRFTADVWTLA